MNALVIILTLISAAFFAISAVLQRYEAGQVEMDELFRGNLTKKLSKNPKWIAAFGLEVLAFLFQAAALKEGSLLVVQPLMTIDLVFLLLILHFHKKIPVGKREWIAILMICGGLSGMLISANPQSGTKPYQIPKLIFVSSIIGIFVCIGIYLARRTKDKSYRAAVSGFAAGLSFALVAVFTKIVTQQLGNGPLYIVSHWQVWALFLIGVVSIIMTQNAYSAGPVAVSQPIMEIVEPLISIVLGIYIFGDSVNLDGTSLFFATTTAVIAGTGIALLARSKRLQIPDVK